MINIKIPSVIDAIDFQTDCAGACTFIMANPGMEVCIFDNTNADCVPDDYVNWCESVHALVTKYQFNKILFGIRNDFDHTYFILTVLYS